MNRSRSPVGSFAPSNVAGSVARPGAERSESALDDADGLRICCVLDIETAPDRHACVLARRTKGAPTGSPLHEVLNASVLKFRMEPGNVIAGFELSSFHREEYSESDILLNVDRVLSEVIDGGGLLATFNGTTFDLPMIEVRLLRWQCFEAAAVRRIRSGDAQHVDVMLSLSGEGAGRWPTLADACASLGFALSGPHRPGVAGGFPYEREKCENDVIGTAILLIHLLAAHRRSREPIRRGLPELGRHVRAIAPGRPHLERFANSPLLEDDASVWGS